MIIIILYCDHVLIFKSAQAYIIIIPYLTYNTDWTPPPGQEVGLIWLQLYSFESCHTRKILSGAGRAEDGMWNVLISLFTFRDIWL